MIPQPRSRVQRVLHSFRFRLTLWFVAILGVILAGISLFIYFRQIQVLRTETTTRLTAQASQFSTFYQTLLGRPSEEEREEDLPFGISDDNFLFLQDYDVFALLGPDGQVVQKGQNLSSDSLTVIYRTWANNPNTLAPIEYPLSENGRNGETRPYLFLVTPVDLEHDFHAQLILGSPLDLGRQLPRLALALMVVFALTLLIAFGGGYWLADQAMRPVQTITRAAQDLGEHDLNRRLNLDRADELGELAATFDQMLTRLEAAFERQRQFTANASHEFRTPLTIIELETSRALERPRSSKEYEQTLLTIQSENEWMSRLVNELLTLARLDSARAVIRTETVDLRDIAVEVIERLTPLAEKNRVILQTGELAESSVQADRDYLVHLVTNLVENGIKYARNAAPRVLIETGSDLLEGKRWSWVQVSDNGPGIPSEHLPHLFDRFYRIDEARTGGERDEETAASGSGLGLAIVQSIARALGGRVDVQSEVGKGTVFTAWLPAD